MYPHRIRLLGPWDWCPNPAQSAFPARRVTIPCRLDDVGLGAFTGECNWRRRFGLPRTLDANERVWLVLSAVSGEAHAILNGSDLGAISRMTECAEFPVNPFLRERNELVLRMRCEQAANGIAGEVAIEIRREAYLQKLRVVTTPAGERLHGTVISEVARSLEVYAISDRRTIGYEPVTVLTGETPFEIWLDEDFVYSSQPITVDLIDGAVIWHRAEIAAPQ